MKYIFIILITLVLGNCQHTLYADTTWVSREKIFHNLYSNQDYENALYSILCTLKDINGADTHKNLLKAAFCCKYIAQTYLKLNKYKESEKYYKESILLFNDALNNRPHIYTASSLTALGALYHEQGFYKEAIDIYNNAIKIYDLALYPNHPLVIDTLYRIAKVYNTLKNYDKEELILKNIKTICEKHRNKKNIITIYNELSSFYEKQNDTYAANIYRKKTLL